MDSLGFVGLGNMGSRMVRRLLDAGYQLAIHDIRPEAVEPFRGKNVFVASSPEDVSSTAETVLVSLPTPPVVEAVALGSHGLCNGKKAKTYIDLSTTGPRTSMRVADGLRSRGIQVLDAPVSGGVMGAEKGTLTIMVSGPRNLFEESRPILDKIGKNLFYVGDKPGQGQTVKLLNNMLAATSLAITSEAMVLGVESGLDPKVILEVVNQGTGRNSATEDAFSRWILNRKFDSGFRTSLLYKDLKLCMEEAEALEATMLVGSAVRELWRMAVSRGGGEKDVTTVIQHMEDWAGVKVSSSG